MGVKNLTLQAAERLINKYQEAGGIVTEVRPGVLGLGTVILSNGENTRLKEFVIQEFYINAWTSGHKLRTYLHGLPAKYQAAI